MLTANEDFWKIFKETNGALSCAEAIAIMDIASQAPKGNYIELGSFKLKSAMSAFIGLKPGLMVLLEPLFEEDEMKNHIDLVLKSFNFRMPTTLFLPEYSTEYLSNPKLHTAQLLDEVVFEKDNFSYVFVDSGSHQDGLPMQEVRLLEDRMVQGGIIAFHDWNSQFKEVKEASDYLVSTGKYEYIPINWDEINSYVDEHNLEEGNLSWHHTELKNPNFVGALRRK